MAAKLADAFRNRPIGERFNVGLEPVDLGERFVEPAKVEPDRGSLKTREAPPPSDPALSERQPRGRRESKGVVAEVRA